MATKEKWVELFEQVIGRKPKPEEFIAGRKSDFDLKLIKTIASSDETSDSPPAYNSLSAKNEWLSKFEQLTNRKPTAEEFLYAKNMQFDLSTLDDIKIESNVESEQLPNQSDNIDINDQIAATENKIDQKQLPSQSEQQQNSDSFNLITTEQTPPYHSTVNRPVQIIENIPTSKKIKLRTKLLTLLGLIVLSLGGIYLYLDSRTGIDVAVNDFIKEINDENYSSIAKTLSSKDVKWSKSDAKSLIHYTLENVENIDTEFENIIKSNGKHKLTDNRENTIISFKEQSKLFGIFSQFKPIAHPVKAKINTNLSDGTATVDGKKMIPLKKDGITSIENLKLSESEMIVKGNTDLGTVESTIILDLDKLKNNELELDLKTNKKQINIQLPSIAESVEKIELIINGKKVADGLTAELQVVNGQKLEIYSKFEHNGNSYTTNKEEILVSDQNINVSLSLSNDLQKRITDSIKAQKAKELDAQKAQKAKDELNARNEKITNFLNSYRNDVFNSIANRANYYAQYYDTSSASYNEMVAWTTGGGVAEAKIDYYTPGALNIKDIKDENDVIVVSTYEDFTVHYIDNTPNTVSRKTKVYYLKPSGDSFIISNLVVSNH